LYYGKKLRLEKSPRPHFFDDSRIRHAIHGLQMLYATCQTLLFLVFCFFFFFVTILNSKKKKKLTSACPIFSQFFIFTHKKVKNKMGGINGDQDLFGKK
jgi:cobalamin synthase